MKIFDREENNRSTLNNDTGIPPVKTSLPQQVTASMHTGSGAGQAIPGVVEGNWTDLVDEVIYPRLKFRERYMETPEAPL